MASYLNEIKDNLSSVSNPNQILNRGVDKQRNLFLKGLKSTSSGQKEDPTYTGFRIMFDMGHNGLVDPETFLPISPLFSNGRSGEGNPKMMKMDGSTDFFHLSRQKMYPFPNYTEKMHYMTAEGYLRQRRSKAENGLGGNLTDNTGRVIAGDRSQILDSSISHRADSLVGFKNILTSVNEKSPWFIQSIEGLDKILSVTPPRQVGGGSGYKEQRSGILTFDCMDSIDLRINAMAELYRKATYDYQNHRELLPANLRKFRMWIIVTEIRQIDLQKNLGDVLNPFNMPGVANAAESISNIAKSAGILKDKSTESENPKRDLDSFVKSFERMQPYIMIYQLDLCEFNFDESYAFNTLSNSVGASGTPVKNRFKVHVGSVKEYKLQYNILSDLIRNESIFAPILIQDSWNLLGSKILMKNATTDNNTNLFRNLANNFINNSVASVVQQQVSPIVTGALLGNAYGFRLSDAVRSLNSVQDAVNGLSNIKSPFQNARPQANGLGGPSERQYPVVSEDVYPNNSNPPINGSLGNILPGAGAPGTVGANDVYPNSPGNDLGLPSRIYPKIKEDVFRNVGGDLTNRDLGVPDRIYDNLPKDDIYPNSPGSDLGLPKRVYVSTKNEDLYPDSPGKDLGVPDRVYKESDGGNMDLYPDSPGSSLGLPDRAYPVNTGDDQYPNSPGSDLGVPDRNYKTISERVYK
jgi:hypothetical protein